MILRSQTRGKNSKYSEKSESSSFRSSVSSATVQARVLAAEAQLSRRLADLERTERERALAAERAERERALADERAVAEAEHRALVASLEAQSNGSRRSSRRTSRNVQDWLDREDGGNSCSIIPSCSPQALMETSHTLIPASVPYLAPVDAMVVSPLDATLPATGQDANPQLSLCHNPRDHTHSLPNTISILPISLSSTTASYHHDQNSLPKTTSTYYPTYFSAPIYTSAPQGGTSFVAAPAPRPRAVCVEETHWSGLPTCPAKEDTLTCTRTRNLGTRPNINYCYDNSNKNISSNKNDDTLQLAQAVANIAVAAGCRNSPKVSVNLPIFDGTKPTDWLFFRRAYQTSSSSYSQEENLARIGAALRAPARDAVAVMLAAGSDPLDIISALEVEFARPERIVLAQLAIIRALPRISNQETAREINAFSCRVRHCLEVVRLLDMPEYASPELSNEIVGKFPTTLRSRWTCYAYERERNPVRRPRMELLSEFLKLEAEIKSKYDYISEPVKHEIVKPVRCHVTTNDATQSLSKAKISNKVCLFCSNGGHITVNCKAFSSITTEERWNWVTKKKVCHKCFSKGNHFYRKCKKFSCTFPNCLNKTTHHSLLHREVPQVTVTNIDSNNDDCAHHSNTGDDVVIPDNVVVAHNSTPEPSRRSLLKMVPISVSGPRGTVNTYALLDDGSTATLVDASIAEAVGATGKRSVLRVNAVGGMSKESDVTFVSVKVKGRHSSETFNLENVRAIANLSLSSQIIECNDLLAYNHLKDLIEELSYDEAKPMVLIGIDNWHLTMPLAVKRGNRHEPAAVLTSLGWALFGRIKTSSLPEVVNCCQTSDTDSLDSQLREYFQIDGIGISKKEYLSENDRRAIDILNNRTRRLPDGRFETGLLWRAEIDRVPSSRSRDLALSRFRSLEKKMVRDKAYADAYREYIRSTIRKRYAELCTEPPNGNNIAWYLPHFGVVHPQKRKLRVVLDAAATSSGISLNSLLLSGPDLLQPLLAILMRFREGAVALNGDIREMFSQTKIRHEDRDAQRFFWRDDPSHHLQEYRMGSMIFGATSSPTTANYLKNLNAEEHRSISTAAADAIIKDHYMDDYLGSVDTVSEATQLAADIVRIHSEACLEMRSWVSNRPEALSTLPPNLRASNAASTSVRILGVTWDVNADTLCFSLSSMGNLPAKLTKRSTLAYLMKIYDPLGLLTPIIVRGRVIFQKTWKLGIDWDQELPLPLLLEWKAWFAELSKTELCAIPRHYLGGRRPESRELHVFGDASEIAYACVAYWRFSCSNGDVMISLIGGKARVAPVKLVSIPRLELQAALMAARFASYIVEAHKHKPSKLYLWSDSLTVLKWLRSDARDFRPFVAHRVGEIAEISNVSNWRYVPTALNVADDATRNGKKFEISSRWFSGPSFLYLPESKWPTEPIKEQPPVPEEMKHPPAEFVALTIMREMPDPVVPDATRFSKWVRLLRASARVLVCANIFKAMLLDSSSKFPNVSSRCRESIAAKHREPTAEDLIRAEERLLLHSQIVSLREDYIRINHGKPPTSNGRLKNLTLFLEESTNLLRLSGRITAVEGVPNVSQNPIVLDGKDRIVRLLIAYHHERAAHSNNELVVNELRQRFHVIGLRPAVKSVASTCLRCRIRKSTPLIPPTGDLPPERLAHHVRPFTCVGLDYFGPVSITVARHIEKRYVALFTCLTVRAVHLEIVGKLSTDAAIMALRRFIARRGTPTTLYSDNGTAFVGASRELARLYEQPVQEFAANQRIAWKFIPPSAPFMGGCWERLVRSIKIALSATLTQQAPSEEVFQTFLLEAESLVNSRPLTHVNVGPNEEGAITPFHFILGSSSPYSVVSQVDDADLIRRVKWRRGLRLADQFWSRWVREYLPTLIPRRLSGPSGKVKVGDLVLIADGNLPRGVWPRGRVARTFPGKDGVVRVVEVATTTGTLRRPVRKLVLLP